MHCNFHINIWIFATSSQVPSVDRSPHLATIGSSPSQASVCVPFGLQGGVPHSLHCVNALYSTPTSPFNQPCGIPQTALATPSHRPPGLRRQPGPHLRAGLAGFEPAPLGHQHRALPKPRRQPPRDQRQQPADYSAAVSFTPVGSQH
jgi:hypothetical protein